MSRTPSVAVLTTWSAGSGVPVSLVIDDQDREHNETRSATIARLINEGYELATTTSVTDPRLGIMWSDTLVRYPRGLGQLARFRG